MSYDNDFYGWTVDQASALKSGHFEQIDIQNLVEEIETMGRSEKRALESRLTVLLVHLLKWKYQPAFRGRSWKLTIDGQRLNVDDILDDNPSLKPFLDDVIVRAYVKARIKASSETGLDETSLPVELPWTFDQINNPAFYPE
jgi:hypothetical protein